MPATQVQIRRDTDANLMGAVPVQGEMGYNLTTERMHLGDGVTFGGMLLPNGRDIQNSAFTYCTAGGTGDAITTSLTTFPLVGAIPPGFRIQVMITANNTGAVTIDVDGQGPDDVVKLQMGVMQPLEADDLVTGMVYDMMYDGTQFILLGFAPKIAQAWEIASETILGAGISTLDITDGFDDDAVLYYLEFSLGRGISGGGIIQLRYSINGGSSFITSNTYVQTSMGAASGVYDFYGTSSGTTNLFTLTELSNFPSVNQNGFMNPETGQLSLTGRSSVHNPILTSGYSQGLGGNKVNALRFICTSGAMAAGGHVRIWKLKAPL